MTDFLWDCINEPSGDTHSESDDNIDNLNVFSIKLTKTKHSLAGIVTVNESKGSGVFDSIGGVLWEAALILCAHILQNISSFRSNNILELGSGVGLPGLLLMQIRSLTSSSVDECLTLSDNESSVISNLRTTILQQFVDTDVSLKYQLIKLANLNWRMFTPSLTDVNVEDCSMYEENLEKIVDADMDYSNFDLLMGSALCYTSEHVCLADLIKYYLSGRCSSVVICQIGDRQGFSQLLERLVELDVMHTVQPISEETFQLAQRIRKCTSKSSIGFADSNGQGGVDETEDVQFHTQYDFRDCSSLFDGLSSDAPVEAVGEWRSSLLTTPRSAFVMLTAKKGSYKKLCSNL